MPGTVQCPELVLLLLPCSWCLPSLSVFLLPALLLPPPLLPLPFFLLVLAQQHWKVENIVSKTCGCESD